MNLASKIKITNTGPQAYNAPMTRSELQTLLQEYDNHITSLEETICSLKHDINNTNFKLDILHKYVLKIEEKNIKSKETSIFTKIKNIFKW